MKIIGCDLHPRQQTIAMVDSETGAFTEKTLSHEGNALREFYAGLESPVKGHAQPRLLCRASASASHPRRSFSGRMPDK
jgi:hypothetical protein